MHILQRERQIANYSKIDISFVVLWGVKRHDRHMYIFYVYNRHGTSGLGIMKIRLFSSLVTTLINIYIYIYMNLLYIFIIFFMY